MNQRAITRAAVAGGSIASIVFAFGCSSSNPGQDQDGDNGGPDYSSDGGQNPSPEMPSEFTATLVADGVSGAQRVNFAVPFQRGAMTEAEKIKISAGGEELPAARRVLAKYDDGSVRSVQLQVDVDVTANPSLTVDIGVAGASGPEMVDVASTLTGSGTDVHPKVWVVLPQSVLISSTLFGPMVPEQELAGTPLDAWSTVCDYDKWDTDNFLIKWQASRDVWLYDRVTAMYRGYAFTGEQSPLRSAYREADIYRAGMTISNGVATNIAPPTAQDDLKYYYSQGMAMHYLLTGDDRYREAAEAVSARVDTMFNPVYDGGDRFWTERHAGFTLLAHEWALAVTDDKAEEIAARSEAAVTAYLAEQMTYPAGYTDQDARCFAHSATAHGEGFGYNGCSPWMSAILADGLDEYARRVGGERAEAVHAALVRLGRIIARDGRDSTGKPFYWMGVGTTQDEIDDYDEHWGESAYLVAMAWKYSGDAELRTAADELVEGMKTKGIAGQTRSFNWQCRSAVMTPAYLQ